MHKRQSGANLILSTTCNVSKRHIGHHTGLFACRFQSKSRKGATGLNFTCVFKGVSPDSSIKNELGPAIVCEKVYA